MARVQKRRPRGPRAGRRRPDDASWRPSRPGAGVLRPDRPKALDLPPAGRVQGRAAGASASPASRPTVGARGGRILDFDDAESCATRRARPTPVVDGTQAHGALHRDDHDVALVHNGFLGPGAPPRPSTSRRSLTGRRRKKCTGAALRPSFGDVLCLGRCPTPVRVTGSFSGPKRGC